MTSKNVLNVFSVNGDIINIEVRCLKNKDFDGANLYNADLRGMNFEGANFSDATLDNANLRGANCWTASFYKASIKNTDMRSGIFDGADFYQADLTNADVRNSSFANPGNNVVSDFSGAIMIGIQAGGANFLGATYDENTRFSADFDPEVHGMIFLKQKHK
jgi:uncharacterized protein YjbI with pentapeptide repeats